MSSIQDRFGVTLAPRSDVTRRRREPPCALCRAPKNKEINTMQRHHNRTCLVALTVAFVALPALSACRAAADTFDGMLIEFAAGKDVDGNCRPERTITAQVAATGLHAIRGESVYTLPAGITRIPFQAVFRGMDDDGISDDDAVTLLNHPGPCSDLVIDIEIETCEYIGDAGPDRKACPAMKVEGIDAFAAVNLVRSDR